MNNLLKNLKDYWVIIIFFGSFVVTWTNFSNSIASQDKRITALEDSNKDILVTLQKIEVDVAVVRTKLEK